MGQLVRNSISTFIFTEMRVKTVVVKKGKLVDDLEIVRFHLLPI